MGFRIIKNFNLVLLAKQGWRLIQNPSSLTVKVLKATYFPQRDFFNEKFGSKASYVWRSILATRQLLEEHLILKIGIGNSVKIWKDK